MADNAATTPQIEEALNDLKTMKEQGKLDYAYDPNSGFVMLEFRLPNGYLVEMAHDLQQADGLAAIKQLSTENNLGFLVATAQAADQREPEHTAPHDALPLDNRLTYREQVQFAIRRRFGERAQNAVESLYNSNPGLRSNTDLKEKALYPDLSSETPEKKYSASEVFAIAIAEVSTLLNERARAPQSPVAESTAPAITPDEHYVTFTIDNLTRNYLMELKNAIPLIGKPKETVHVINQGKANALIARLTEWPPEKDGSYRITLPRAEAEQTIISLHAAIKGKSYGKDRTLRDLFRTMENDLQGRGRFDYVLGETSHIRYGNSYGMTRDVIDESLSKIAADIGYDIDAAMHLEWKTYVTPTKRKRTSYVAEQPLTETPDSDPTAIQAARRSFGEKLLDLMEAREWGLGEITAATNQALIALETPQFHVESADIKQWIYGTALPEAPVLDALIQATITNNPSIPEEEKAAKEATLRDAYALSQQAIAAHGPEEARTAFGEALLDVRSASSLRSSDTLANVLNSTKSFVRDAGIPEAGFTQQTVKDIIYGRHEVTRGVLIVLQKALDDLPEEGKASVLGEAFDQIESSRVRHVAQAAPKPPKAVPYKQHATGFLDALEERAKTHTPTPEKALFNRRTALQQEYFPADKHMSGLATKLHATLQDRSVSIIATTISTLLSKAELTSSSFPTKREKYETYRDALKAQLPPEKADIFANKLDALYEDLIPAHQAAKKEATRQQRR